jgi:hypothetical protein
MNVDEALVAFARICTAVFPEQHCTSAERASNLEAIAKTLVEECGISIKAKLMDETNSSIACKLYVGVNLYGDPVN